MSMISYLPQTDILELFSAGIVYALIGVFGCAWLDGHYMHCLTDTFGINLFLVLMAIVFWPISMPVALVIFALRKRKKSKGLL